MTSKSLRDLNFDNRFTAELPADDETANHRRQVMGACYSRVAPTPVSNPELVACAREVVAAIDLPEEICEGSDFVEVFAGNKLVAGMDPYAMCYGGHQFGNWAGQLGDGRAINLGEVVNAQGERWALQLKGAGPTPYSRTADGLAVMRSSVREFLCSEAMYHLGVPTTRALCLVSTGDEVVRDILYDGHLSPEPGAVVCRVAPSFTRFGNFEIFAARGETEVLRQLMEYTIRVDFPHLGEPSTEVYLAWFDEVCRTTAAMIVHWMRVGFVHGVMNTDNMSVLGLTIDYGPYGWLEDYDPNWTPNTTDAGGRRYRYGHQPQIAMWNLAQFARALLPVIGEVEPLQQALDEYATHYATGFSAMMAQKLGLRSFEGDADTELINEVIEVLQLVETDMTIFFRSLAVVGDLPEPSQLADADVIAPVAEAFYSPDGMTDEGARTRMAAWLRRYAVRLQEDGELSETRRRRMNSVNPRYVLRNYLAQLAIDKAEEGDPSKVCELLEVLRHPYDDQPGREEFAAKRPEWARHRVGCSMLSCSS